MATRIKLKSSTTASATPTTSDLVDKEVALNIADKKLFVNNNGTVEEIANAVPNTASVTASMFAADITNGPNNTYFVAKSGSDSSSLSGGADRGKSTTTPFLTVAKALTVATAGDIIHIAAGEYTEAAPLNIPDGVTIKGAGLRATQLKPTGGTNDVDFMVLAGDTTVSDLTVKDIIYNSGNDTGYAFVCANNWDSDRSAYINRVTVLNKGSTTSASDPYGFDAGDAGRGAKLDGSISNSNSLETAVLFNEVTFFVPNSVGVYLTNGIRCEWQNSFIYLANEGIKGVQGATGKHGTGQARLKLSGTSGTFATNEKIYQLENQFKSGTYAVSSNVVTVTRTAHGLVTNDRVYADFITGTATDGYYQVTGAPTADTFTFALTTGNTSGNVTYKKAEGYGNIANNDGTYIFLTGKGEGQFTTPLEVGKTLTPNADASLNTTTPKFGTASLALDGTGDFVSIETQEDFGFGTANFCIEAWVYPTSVSGVNSILDFRTGATSDGGPYLWHDGGTVKFGSAAATHITGGTISVDTWAHIAVARYNGSTKLFINGTQSGSTYTDGNNYGNTKTLNIGSATGTGSDYFTGKLDEVRVSLGTARFTGNFTAPSSEYGTDIYTSLLLHFNGDSGSSSFTDAGYVKDIRSDGGDSATGISLVDYGDFGCEFKALASSNIYGNKGAVADGNGCKLNLTAHNFMYIGAGKDLSNDGSLAQQANEAVELNGGRVFYSSTDQRGDFRVGEVFLVDQETGNVNFQSTSSSQQATSIGLSDSTGTTNIYPAYIETGNIRLAGNTISTTSGDLLIDPAGNQDTTFNGEVVFAENAYFDQYKIGSFNSDQIGSIDVYLGPVQKRGGFNAYGLQSDTNLLLSSDGVASVTVQNAGTGYQGGSTNLDMDTDPAVVATATASLDTQDGAVKDITLTNPGTLYTTPPAVTFSASQNAGTAPDASAVLETYGVLNRIDIADGGADYASAPTLTIEAPEEFTFDTETGISGNTLTITGHPFTNNLRIVYYNNGGSETPGLTDGTTYYVINASGDTFQVSTSQGGGAVSLTASASAAGESHSFKGVNATATCTVSAGAVNSITITEQGTLYNGSTTPTITQSDQSQTTDASFTVFNGRSIGSVSVNGRGSGFTSAPTVTITTDGTDTTGSGGTATCTIGFPIGTVTLTNQGSGYNFAPTVQLTGGNSVSEADLTPVFSKKSARLTELTITAPGVCYDTAPTIALEGGAGHDAKITCNIQSLTGTITNAGSGYTPGEYTGVSFTWVSGATEPQSAATADFRCPGWEGTITNAGSGYTDGEYTGVTAFNVPAQTFAVTVITNPGASPPDNVFVIDGSTQAAINMTEGNTYRFDQSDASNVGHTLIAGREDGGTLSQDIVTVVNGTAGSAGAWTDVVVRPGTAGETADYVCQNHANMGASITIAAGAAGNYGDGLTLDAVVTGGVFTSIKSTSSQGQNYAANDTLSFAAADVGGAGSGVIFRLDQQDLTLSEVTNISLTGGPYAVSDVLSVDPANAGGTGSGFQYTVTKVGFIRDVEVAEPGYGYNPTQRLKPRIPPTTTGDTFLLDVTTIATTETFELTHDGAINNSHFKIAGKKDPALSQGTLTIGSGTGKFQVIGETGNSTQAGNAVIDGDLTVKGNLAFGDESTDTLTITGATTTTGDTTQTGNLTLTGDITQTVGDVALTNVTAQFADGTAAAPTLNLVNSATTGLFRSDADTIGVAIAGVEKGKWGATLAIGNDFQVGATTVTASPVLSVDVTNSVVKTGTAAAGLQINNDASIEAIGTDADVSLRFQPKGNGGITFTGGPDRDFITNDGTNETFKLEMDKGDLSTKGFIQANERLKITDSEISNVAQGVSTSFGQLVTLDTSGTGTTFTDGTFTNVAITSTVTGKGSGGTVDVTVVSSSITTVTVNTGGKDYVKGDEITLDSGVIGTDSVQKVLISDVAGTGLSLKPSVARNILCDTTGSLIVPVGDTNSRPPAADTYLGGIRYNTSTSQFEGYNGIDYVSLGGVRDVDQDTYILTEVTPGSDEDTFEFYNAGFNSLSLNKDKWTIRTAKLVEIEGTYTLNGTLGLDTLDVQRKGTSITKVRSSKDFEVTGGLFLKHQLVAGTIASFTDGTLGANPGTFNATAAAYDPSATFTATAGVSEFAGSGATFDIVTDANGTITSITINSGGVNFEAGEIVTIGGGLLGGGAGTDVTFTVATLSNADVAHGKISSLQGELRFNMNSDKQFLSLDSTGAKAAFKVNRNYEAGGNTSYLTLFDSTASFVELDSARVEGGSIPSYSTTVTFTAFDKTLYKGSKTLITLESNDSKVHMFEVTAVCSASGTEAFATVTNSITSDNDLMDCTVSVSSNDVQITLAKSTAASSSTSFTGRYTTTKVKV